MLLSFPPRTAWPRRSGSRPHELRPRGPTCARGKAPPRRGHLPQSTAIRASILYLTAYEAEQRHEHKARVALVRVRRGVHRCVGPAPPKLQCRTQGLRKAAASVSEWHWSDRRCNRSFRKEAGRLQSCLRLPTSVGRVSQSVSPRRRSFRGRPKPSFHRCREASAHVVFLWIPSLPPHRSTDKAPCKWSFACPEMGFLATTKSPSLCMDCDKEPIRTFQRGKCSAKSCLRMGSG